MTPSDTPQTTTCTFVPQLSGQQFIPYMSTLTSSLELVDVEHIGEITEGTLFQKLTGKALNSA